MIALPETMETAIILNVLGDNGVWKKTENLTNNKDGQNERRNFPRWHYRGLKEKPKNCTESIMIASPCKNCPKRNEPKENCMKDCELLQAVQNIQYAFKEDISVSGIDYAEVDRFAFSPLNARSLSAF